MAYFPRLDGLRFVAIFCVLLQHLLTVQIGSLPFGFYGVDLFLVISGFLITSILIQPAEKDFKTTYLKFIFRRTLRIVPIYYFTLAVLWFIDYNGVRENICFLLTYTYNYALVYHNLPMNGIIHFWSLSLEEQFYLFWPFLAIPLRLNKKSLILLTIGIIIFGYAQMTFGFIKSINAYNYVGLLTRMSSLGLGALVAILKNNKMIPRFLVKSKLAECVTLVILLISFLFPFKFGATLMGLCSAVLVLKATESFHTSPLEYFLRNKYVTRVGALSYGIYLFHLPLSDYFHKYIFSPVWLSIDFTQLGILARIQWHPYIFEFPLAVAVSFLVATFSFRYFEKPILKWRDAFILNKKARVETRA